MFFLLLACTGDDPGFAGTPQDTDTDCNGPHAFTTFRAKVELTGTCEGSGELILACVWTTTEGEEVCFFGPDGDFLVTDGDYNGKLFLTLPRRELLAIHRLDEDSGSVEVEVYGAYDDWLNADTVPPYEGYDIARLSGTVNQDGTAFVAAVEEGGYGSWLEVGGPNPGICPGANVLDESTGSSEIQWKAEEVDDKFYAKADVHWVEEVFQSPTPCE